MSKRNGAVSLVKIFFVSLVIVMHYTVPSQIFPPALFWGAYIFVDFFFILQGFYLVHIRYLTDSRSSAYENTINYAKNRLARFFPCVFFNAILLVLLQIDQFSDGKHMLQILLGAVMQCSFVSELMPMILLDHGGILWFLSASIIAGMIVVFLITLLGKHVILPFVLCSSLIYNGLFSAFGHLNVWHDLTLGGCMMQGILRGLAGVMLGFSLRFFSEWLNTIRFRSWVIHCSRLGVLACLAVVVGCTLWFPHTITDFFVIWAFMAIILILNHPKNVFSSRITDVLDQYCMEMYIFQVAAILFVTKFIKTPAYHGILPVFLVDIVFSTIFVRVLSKVDLKKMIIRPDEQQVQV